MVEVRADDHVLVAERRIASRQDRDDVVRRHLGWEAGVRGHHGARDEPLEIRALAEARPGCRIAGARRGAQAELGVASRDVRRRAVVPGGSRSTSLERVAREIDDVLSNGGGVHGDARRRNRRRATGADGRAEDERGNARARNGS